MHTKTQVIIIGGGPTGLSMATQLMRYEIDFIVLEKNEHTTLLSKAVVVQARTLEIFQQMNLAQTALEKGKITSALSLFYKGKQRAFIPITNLGKGLTQFPYALSLEQSKTETLLAEHLNNHHKFVSWKCTFTHCEQNKDSITVYYKDADGKEQSIDADYIVGCDGAHSLIRHEIGSGFQGDTVPKLFYVADVILNSSVINKDSLFAFLIKKGFVLFFPMEGTGHYRVIGILPDHKETYNTTYEFSDVEKFIKNHIHTPVDFKELKWFSTYKVHSRMADTFMRDRCFIAGDAAHIHTPAGGQGMNTGIQDAYNLAWKLAYVLQKKMNHSVLKTYNSERMENARHLLNTTDKMFDVIAGTNFFWNFVRLKIIPSIAGLAIQNSFLSKRIFPLISQTGISYPNSALTLKSAIENVHAGDRMPYFVFSDNTPIYDYLKLPGFACLFFGTSSCNFDFLKKLNTTVPSYTFTEIPKNIFGNASNFYILLRPDNHIVYIGPDLKDYIVLLENMFAEI